MSWRWPRGIRLAKKRLDAFALHQHGNMQPPDLDPFLNQQPLQHPATREREFHIQLVDPVHQHPIVLRHWAGLVTDTAPADPQDDGLAADAQLGGGIDHFLTLGNRPAWPSAPDKKIILRRQLSDLRMQCLHIDGLLRLCLRGFPEHPSRGLKQLIAPLFNLVRMNVELLRQLDHGLLALDRRHRHFCLECRAVVPTRSSCHGLFLARSIMLLLRGKSTCPGCTDFRSHLYPSGTTEADAEAVKQCLGCTRFLMGR